MCPSCARYRIIPFKEWVMDRGLAQQCDDLKASKGNYSLWGLFYPLTTRTGDGPGKSADNRLHTLENMLETAGDLIDIDDIEGACEQLKAALGKCDGVSPPPDFVAGPAATELHNMILELMDSLGCE